MKPKKKDQVVQAPKPDIEEDREKFIQTFQKPTKIYRYMRTRFLVSPIFLQRSLYYMKHRRSTNSNKRDSFKVDSLLGKKTPICKQEQLDERSSSTNNKFLKLEFVGFYYNQVAASTREVEVEAIVTKINQYRKDGNSSPSVKQTCLGQVSVPVNPDTTSCNQSSLDGTQSDGFQPCTAVIISREGFSFSKKSIESCVLHLSVTCHLKHHHANGIVNGDAAEPEEPRSKRRRSEAHVNHVSCDDDDGDDDDDDDIVVYGTELCMYGGHNQCLLKNGDYEHCLQELGSKFPTRKDITLEAKNGKKSVNSLDIFGACPKLKFKLCWTDDADGTHPCQESPSEFLSNNTLSNINFSGFGIDSSTLKLKQETQSTPQKKISVTYHFLYDNNTRQQTDTRNNLHCPWCSVNCGKLYSLLKHLRLCHARFNFIYAPCPKGARIDVSVNDSYDGSYMGNPQDLNSHIGFAFSRLGPVRRTSITHVVVYRPKRPVPSLLEFYEPEKENQVTRQIIQGHNRLYYRTATCMPLKPQEVTQDSEDETSPQWLQQKSINLIDEFTDVNEGEKELMKLWNVHCMKHAYIADCQIPLACETFIKEHGEAIVRKGIMKNFLVHLVNMFDYSLLCPDTVQRTMWQLQVLKDDMEMSGTLSSSRTSETSAGLLETV